MIVVQILLCYLIYGWTHVESIHVGEVGVKNGFDFQFKPIPFKPIAFIKEVFGPWGKWGMKHGIEKRDLDKIKPLEVTYLPPPAPLKEMSRLPAEVYEPLKEYTPVPPPFLHTPIVQPAPIPAPPPPPVVITPPPKPIHINELEEEKEKDHKLHTDIYKEELINTYLKGVEDAEKVLPPIPNDIGPVPVEKPKDEVPPPPEENPIVRGSKLALYFGNILLDVIARFFGRP